MPVPPIRHRHTGKRNHAGNHATRWEEPTANARQTWAIIEALERVLQISFSSHSADARETLVYDAVAGRFILTVFDPYDPEATLTRELTGDELGERLRTSFSYASFGLPPVGTPLAG